MYIEFSFFILQPSNTSRHKDLHVTSLFESLLILRSQLLARDKNGRIELFTDRENGCHWEV